MIINDIRLKQFVELTLFTFTSGVVSKIKKVFKGLIGKKSEIK